MRRAALAGAVLGLVLTALGAVHAEEPVKIRVGWITVPTSLAPILFAKPELATHLDKSYSVEPLRFAGSTPMITALASGDLDIAELSFSSFGYAIQNARMEDLRIIADEIEDGVEGWRSYPFLVLKDGPVRTIDDLKGRVLATNVIGAGIDIGMRSILRRHGLEDKRDYTMIEADYANMIGMLQGHKADLVSAPTVFTDRPEVEATVRPLFTLRDAMGGKTQLLSLAARAPFIAQNRAALVDYMEDDLRSLRWYLDPKNRDEALEILAQFTKQPASRFEDWAFTPKDQYRNPTGRPDLAALQENLRLQKEFGFLKIDIDVPRYADLSLVDEANERLKESQ